MKDDFGKITPVAKLVDALAVVPQKVGEQIKVHPLYFLHACVHHSNAIRKMERQTSVVEQVEAEAASKSRLIMVDGKKPTETSVKEAVALDANVIKETKTLRKLAAEERKLKALVEAYRHRRDSLQMCLTLRGFEGKAYS